MSLIEKFWLTWVGVEEIETEELEEKLLDTMRGMKSVGMEDLTDETKEDEARDEELAMIQALIPIQNIENIISIFYPH